VRRVVRVGVGLPRHDFFRGKRIILSLLFR
jgi:hypothetical protein